jgi:hypothetical protein
VFVCGASGAAGRGPVTPILHSSAQSLRSFALSLQNRGRAPTTEADPPEKTEGCMPACASTSLGRLTSLSVLKGRPSVDGPTARAQSLRSFAPSLQNRGRAPTTEADPPEKTDGCMPTCASTSLGRLTSLSVLKGRPSVDGPTARAQSLRSFAPSLQNRGRAPTTEVDHPETTEGVCADVRLDQPEQAHATIGVQRSTIYRPATRARPLRSFALSLQNPGC